MYCKVCSCVGPIEVKGKDESLLHIKHGERSYSSRNQRLWVPLITDLVHLGATTSRSEYHFITSRVHDITLRVPNEVTLLNVHTTKDEP